MIVTCGDIDCQFYKHDGCVAPEVHHTDERFCVTGRRKEKDYAKELMNHFNPGCSGKKSINYKVVK